MNKIKIAKNVISILFIIIFLGIFYISIFGYHWTSYSSSISNVPYIGEYLTDFYNYGEFTYYVFYLPRRDRTTVLISGMIDLQKFGTLYSKDFQYCDIEEFERFWRAKCDALGVDERWTDLEYKNFEKQHNYDIKKEGKILTMRSFMDKDNKFVGYMSLSWDTETVSGQ